MKKKVEETKKSAEVATTEPATKATKPAKLKCVWNMGFPCKGKVEMKKILFGQIEIPICDAHLEAHKDIMILHKNNYDVEAVLNMTPEERKREALTLTVSKLDNGELEL